MSMNNIEFNIFRRFMAGKSYLKILGEIKNEEILKEICTKLSRKGLLI